ncbi:Polysaccharide biosynthesis/export protein [Rubripirellula tenax]|uniref:Polysaccharide biosynthesis/export protein n=2 Tax=Rubripirellula tenax TaxID=2528015 RepID=A0A5C6EPG8_9BACT|nr:Polysaccharide biosynthesis/export protein [Rubripirellula tenax]
MTIMLGWCVTGCRTAASLGLPVDSGSNSMLSSVAEMRQKAGHQPIPTELAKAALPAHRVEAGDVLVIEPNDFNSPVRLQSDQTVQQDGTIDLGAYGRVAVAGRSTREIQQEVESLVTGVEIAKRDSLIGLASHRTGGTNQHDPALDPQVDYGVNVRLVNQDSTLYYVMGEVNAPGSYPMVGNETVLDAIIAAGGLSDRSNDHKIILVRPKQAGEPRMILPVCYQQVLQLGDVSTNYQLLPGDRIYVPAISFAEDVRQSLRIGGEKSCPYCKEYSKR